MRIRTSSPASGEPALTARARSASRVSPKSEVEREAEVLERALKRDMEKWPSVFLYELVRMGSPFALEELGRRKRGRRKPLDLDL